jgi:four helix bundle protein
MTLQLEELEVYRLSEALADRIWSKCVVWDYFSRDTLGKQLIRSADSIGANISEGYGRFSFKENIQFCYYARGSLKETEHFLRRAGARKLLDQNSHDEINAIVVKLGPKLNAYINSIRNEYQRTVLARTKPIGD